MVWKRKTKTAGRSKVKNAKKSTYDGKNFQSNLELYCYKQLEEAKFIIETKGYANESFPLRWKLFKKHLKDNNHHYVLFMPRNKKQVDEVVDLIKQL